MSPYASSSLVHHALSGTTTAPVTMAPQKAQTHSGRLRDAMATRSPLFTPRLTRRSAIVEAMR